MSITVLRIRNDTDETQLFYLTLGSYPAGYVQDVKDMFGIESGGLQGSFKMIAGEDREYKCLDGMALSGNFSAGSPPLNQPPEQFPNGINLFEFTLNNRLILPPGQQETVDISCVAGVNAHWKGFVSGKPWNASPLHPSVVSFENGGLEDNHGRVGVFPYGCDNCTKITSPPTWPNHPPFDKPQDHPICNVQRPAGTAGGMVEAHFLGII